MADFPEAVKILDQMSKSFPTDNALKRSFAHALILNQNAAAGKKLLESIPSDAPERHAALAGALARSIEYYITEKDAESGQQTWEKWQQQYPADFLEGYSIMLQTRLMEIADIRRLRKWPDRFAGGRNCTLRSSSIAAANSRPNQSRQKHFDSPIR